MALQVSERMQAHSVKAGASQATSLCFDERIGCVLPGRLNLTATPVVACQSLRSDDCDDDSRMELSSQSGLAQVRASAGRQSL